MKLNCVGCSHSYEKIHIHPGLICPMCGVVQDIVEMFKNTCFVYDGQVYDVITIEETNYGWEYALGPIRGRGVAIGPVLKDLSGVKRVDVGNANMEKRESK